jgi:hypothetical protein
MASPDETLAAEARARPRAGAAAVAAGVLIFAGTLITTLVFQAGPDDDSRVVSVVDALRNRVQEGRPSGPGLTVDQAAAFGDRAVPLALGGLLLGLGVLAILPALSFLFRAVRSRVPGQRNLLILALVAGSVLTGVGFIVFHLFLAIQASGFEAGPGTTAGAARDALQSGTVLVGQFLASIGRIVLAVAIALIALNAMRTGLLTRFLGILGVIVGLLWVLPFDQFALIRGFWLVLVGLLILGRVPRTTPTAWRTGRAEPWPTRQELREGRVAEAGETEPPPAAARGNGKKRRGGAEE